MICISSFAPWPLILLINTTPWYMYVLQVLGVVVAAFIVFCLFSSYFRFQKLAGKLTPGPASTMSPETVGPAEPFQVELMMRLSQLRGSRGFFAMLSMRILPQSGDTALTEDEQALFHSQVWETLRSSLRKTDLLFDNGQGVCRCFLSQCDRNHAEKIAQRVDHAMKRQPVRLQNGRLLRPQLQQIVCAVPECGESLKELIQALRLAEDQWSHDRHLICVPRLTAETAISDDDAEREAAYNPMLDMVTGLLKYARVPTALQKYMATHRRRGDAVVMLLLDVDDLERYNRQYGREAGDRILKEVGDLLHHFTRESDFLGRFEEDSIVVMLPGTLNEGEEIARRTVTDLRRRIIQHDMTRLRATVSVGIGAFPEHGRTPRDLYKHCLTAVAESRRKGGNAWSTTPVSVSGSRRENQWKDIF